MNRTKVWTGVALFALALQSSDAAATDSNAKAAAAPPSIVRRENAVMSHLLGGSPAMRVRN